MPTLLWIVVICLATWGAWVIVTTREIPNNQKIITSEANGNELPERVLMDAPIIEEMSADGTLHWTLYLHEVLREEGSLMELDQPRVLYKFRSGEVLEVRGDSGTYDEELGVLVLTGNVTGETRNSKLGFSASEVAWDSGTQMLSTSGGVRLYRSGILLEGGDLRLDLSEELSRLEISGGTDGVHITSIPGTIEEIRNTGE